MALRALHRIGEQGQRGLVAPLGEMYPGSQRQSQPTDRTGGSSAHRSPQQCAHFLGRAVLRITVEQREHDLEHQSRADLTTVVIRIDKPSQQFTALFSLHLSLRARTAATLAGCVCRPGSSPQQQSGVMVEARVLTIELIGLLERGGDELVAAALGQRLNNGDERTAPRYRSDVVSCRQHRTHRAERDSRLTQRDRTVRQLHVQLVPQPRWKVSIVDRRDEAVNCFPVPPETVERKNREVICPQDGHLVTLRSGHRPIGQQERQLGRSPTQEHRRFHQRCGLTPVGRHAGPDPFPRRAAHLPPPSLFPIIGRPMPDQPRVNLRCVTRCGRAASAPSRSILCCS